VHGVGPDNIDKYRVLVGKVAKIKRDGLVAAAGVWDKARLVSAAAPHAGAWLDRRLGGELCAEGPCSLCLGIMDKFGVHAECCTCGGDKTLAHRYWRNDLYAHSKRGNTAPVLEAAGVLPT
jgi:hypothetical protein